MKIVSDDYRDETRLEHMLQALLRIQAITTVMTRDRLFLDDVNTRALMYDFTVLGEAANNVSDEYCAEHPELDWKGVAGFRHRLVHDYAGIDYGILWDAMTIDVPMILPKIRAMVEMLSPAKHPDSLGDFF